MPRASTFPSVSSSDPYDVIIIGGGVAGLVLAKRALQDNMSVIVLEKRAKVGGRVRTATDDAGHAMYENGAWRVPADHLGTQKLYAALRETKEVNNMHPLQNSQCTPPGQTPLAAFQTADWTARAANHSVAHAATCDYQTAFPGASLALDTTYESESDDMFTTRDGLQEPLVNLAHALRCVKTGVFVTDVRRSTRGGQWHVTTQKGDVYYGRSVVLTAPPWQWTLPSVAKELRPAAALITPLSLCHMYINFDGGYGKWEYKADLLGALYPHQHMASTKYNLHAYTAGAAADTVSKLQIAATPKEFKKMVSLWLAKRGWKGTVHDVAVAYNQRGVSQWSGPIKRVERDNLRDNVIEVDPIRAPGFFLAGEPWSAVQGWIQGAINSAHQTFAAVVGYLKGNRLGKLKIMRRSAITNDMVVVGSRVVDIAAFARVHPGGAQAFASFRKGAKSAEDVFSKIHSHRPVAQRQLALLTVGWLDEAD